MHRRRTITDRSTTNPNARRRRALPVAALSAMSLLAALLVLVPAAFGSVSPAAADTSLSATAAISVGGGHACAVTPAGGVWCWGDNASGELGNGTTTPSAVPVPVTGLGAGVTAVAAGNDHTCALLATGGVRCWGTGGNGRLGNGSNAASSLPLAVSGVTTAVAIAVGGSHSCAATSAGAMVCWGRNFDGALGNGTTSDSSLPVAVAGLSSGVTSIAAGESHSCAVVFGAAKCWGYGAAGNLGDGAGTRRTSPVNVSGLGSGVVAVDTGYVHSCALTSGGAVLCWGSGADGQLGDGTTATRYTPVSVSGLSSGVGSISTGSFQTCAVTSSGAVTCWGGVPAVVPSLGSGVASVSAGVDSSCALLPSATVRCWGYNNHGQLGDGSTTTSTTPVLVTGGHPYGPFPALSVAVSTTETASAVGETIHVQVAVTNAGYVPVTGVAITDAHATGCQAPPFALSVGETHTVDCTHVAEEADRADGYRNSASAVATEVTTPWVSNTTTVPVAARAPGLTLAQTVDETTVVPGQAIHYHLLVTNTGNVVLHGVDLTDARAPDCADDAPFDLAVGGTATVDCQRIATGNDLGTYPNTAKATSVEVTTPVVSNRVTVVVQPAVSVVLSADESAIVLGATIHYHLLLTNHSASAVNDIEVTDADVDGCAGPVADLAAGAALTVECTHTPTATGTFPHTATVDSPDIPAVSSNRLDVDVAAPAPASSVSVAADEDSVLVGDDIHLHVAVDNTGNVDLHQVTIDTPGAAGCEVAPFTLAVGDESTVDCTHTASSGDVPAFTGEATVTATELTTPEVSNAVEVSVAERAPAIALEASADEVSVAPGQAIHQHLVVSNTGNLALHAVTISDPAAPDCADDGAFDLAVGGFTTIDCAYTTTGNDAGTYTNEASVTADEVATPVASNPVDVTVEDAVTVVLSADRSSVVAGEVIGYHVTVKNTSALLLAMPEVAYASTPECDGAMGLAAELAPGAQVTVACDHVSSGAEVGTLSNVATVDSAEILAVDSDPLEVTVAAAVSALTVTQTADEASVVAGEPVHLHLTVANTGNVALHGVTVVDPHAPACEVAPFALGVEGTLVVPAEVTIDCAQGSTGADVPIYQNKASVGADELTAAVDSNIVSVAVTIPTGSAHVAGTVTETGSGVPIAGAVAVLLSPADFSPVAVATAGPSGHFSALAEPGSYFVYVVDPADDHAAGFHGAPTLVDAVVDTTTGADTELRPTRGTLSGAVTDDTTGDPLTEVLAISVDLDQGRPGAGAVTDADGGYRISGLRPGSDLLEFVDLTGGHRVEFFDDAPTPDGSSVLTVIGAEETVADAGLAAQAAPTGGAGVAGQVTSTTGEPLAGVVVMAVHAADFSLASGVLTDATGHYALDLDPGDYKVAFYDPSGTHGFEWHDDQGPDGLATAATVTAGDPAAVDAALTPTTGFATGTVTEAGSGTPLGEVAVFAIDTGGSVVAVAPTAADGTYTLAGLPAGDVRLRFVDLTGLHATEYYDDSPDYDGASLIAAGPGATTPGVDAELSLAG